jgi:superfamily II DNA/RNA helicase
MWNRLIAFMPQKHQTMFYSRVFTSNIADFVLKHLKSPSEIGLDDVGFWVDSFIINLGF